MRLKNIWGVALLALVLSAPAAAQGTDVVAQAKADLQKVGVSLSGACGAIKITNLVVWRLRPQFGLLYKAGGFRAVLRADGSCQDQDQTNEGGFANDYIIDRTTGFGFDLLGDGGGANNPQWNGPEDAPEIVLRNRQNFREPFDPSVYLFASTPTPAPNPAPVPVPVPVPVPPPLPSIDLTVVLARLSAIELRMTQLEEIERQDTEAVRGDIKSFRDAANNVLKVVAKYVAPVVAGVVGGMKLK